MTDTLSPDSQWKPSWRRTILYHAPREAMGPMTDVILGRLGYQILRPGTLAQLQETTPGLRPELRLVDERRLDEVPGLDEDDPDGKIPIVLLTGKMGAREDDPRVVGAVKRPAGMHDLYRLMQQVFEDKPRSTPRVQACLPAHCESRGVSWNGQVISLSENGCLIRSPEPIQLGQILQLELQLPKGEWIALQAEAAYQLLPDTGLVFNALNPNCRKTLEQFVTEAILS
jgi:hypothetical protein